MTISVWYAVSVSGQGGIFTNKPLRSMRSGIWTGEHVGFLSAFVSKMEANGFVLPDINWNDEPIELLITLDYG